MVRHQKLHRSFWNDATNENAQKCVRLNLMLHFITNSTTHNAMPEIEQFESDWIRPVEGDSLALLH